MCGLTGLLRSSPSDDIIAQVARMTARLVHRGPDDEGVWTEGVIGLGHRRLAIIDLSATGAQPMHSDCGRYVLAYNGEVYNHLDLRRALEVEGAAPPWRGQSDTETLLAAIAHWGLDDALIRAHGMFALALVGPCKKSAQPGAGSDGGKAALLGLGWEGSGIWV